MRVHAVRLPPGSDLKTALEQLVRTRRLEAGFILTGVGSLSHARLRMPGGPGDAELFMAFEEPLEIVSLVGTLGSDGLHLHLSLSRRNGDCVGGHLVYGCRIRTTAELVIGEARDLIFKRRLDPATGYNELDIQPRSPGEDSPRP